MTNEQLSGRRALVTGGSRGIGEAISLRFAEEGAAVAIAGRDAEAVAAAVERLQARGATAVGIAGDVAEEEDASRIVAEAASGLGGLDVVVNNAAVDTERWGKVHEWEIEEWDRIIAIDLRGPFLISHAALPHLLSAGGGALLHKYGPQGIRSNTLMPGVVLTAGARDFLESSADAAELEARHPIGRFGTPEEVAAMAVSLCAPEPAFLTGANIPIDGGYSRV